MCHCGLLLGLWETWPLCGARTIHAVFPLRSPPSFPLPSSAPATYVLHSTGTLATGGGGEPVGKATKGRPSQLAYQAPLLLLCEHQNFGLWPSGKPEKADAVEVVSVGSIVKTVAHPGPGLALAGHLPD
jgi:hypothetical protein